MVHDLQQFIEAMPDVRLIPFAAMKTEPIGSHTEKHHYDSSMQDASSSVG